MSQDIQIVVLNTIKYKDSGVVVQAYSDRGGRDSFFLRSGKKSGKGGLLSHLHPLNIIDITLSSFSLGEIATIKEFSAPYKLKSIRSNLIKSSIAIYMSELIYKSIREIEPNPQMYSFLIDSILRLEAAKEGIENFHLCFTTQLCRQIGYLPAIDNIPQGYLFDIPSASYVAPANRGPDCFSDKSSEILGFLASSDYKGASEIALTGAVRSEFLGEMLRYLVFHAGDSIKIESLDVLHEVFD